jgi:ring-1,2-phenylacetyl-CoA epoxidase subunit PaaB
MRRGSESNVYEVFARFGDDAAEPIRWLGSVRSGDAELAWHAAKEIYTRREDCTVLWVAQRSHMVVSEPGDAEALRSPSRLGYRVPAFPGRHRRARLKAAAVAAAEELP